MKNTQKGFIKHVTFVVVAVCLLFIVFAVLANRLGTVATSSFGNSAGNSSADSGGNNSLLSFLGNSNSGYSNATYESNGTSRGDYGTSPYSGSVFLSSGNASYSIQPYEEYVTIRNSGSPVNITGWTLTNGKGTHPIQTSQNSYVYPTADSATIGQGTEFLNPSGVFQVGPIVLNPGDTAIVTTGQPFAQFPYSISTSFRENICEGYLKDYPFTPQLNYSCPYITNDPDIRSVTSECYDYMQSLSRCEDPEKYDKKAFDLQTSFCKDFMTSRLNYPMCVARNRNSAGFSINQWRVFLGKKAEMWARDKETITLYDSKGLIVDQISY